MFVDTFSRRLWFCVPVIITNLLIYFAICYRRIKAVNNMQSGNKMKGSLDIRSACHIVFSQPGNKSDPLQ